MSSSPDVGGSPDAPLQFDQAEFTAPRATATCKACGQELRDVYYDVNGQPFCPACRERLQQALTGGSAVGRFLRASLYGSLAGLLGAAIYYGVRELTNIEFGLISIVVGLMIGGAVKKGCNARGGWLYQSLAIFLTYTSIVLTYIPPAIQAIREQAKQDAAGKAGQPAQPDGQAAAPAQADAPPEADAAAVPNIFAFLFALVALFCLAYALPVVVGFQHPMVLVIVGIGLYEAWAINKRPAIAVGGPYRIGQADAGNVVHAEPAT